MGFYSNHDKTKTNQTRRRQLLILLLGVMLTGAFILWILPNMSTAFKKEEISRMRSSSESPSSMQHVTLQVTSQITEIVEKVAPSVVGVTNLQIQRNQSLWSPEEEAAQAGTGSGVLYKKNARYSYIVTNHHVIAGADEIEVILSDETSVRAELLGSDLFSDLAVLRIESRFVQQVAEIGSSEAVKVGEPVIAIGNPLGHMFAGSVTQGIISGKQRTIPQDFDQDGRSDWQAEVLQTDAAINPGNSGGALLNIRGQLIGINSMKINESAVEGMSFSIPIDTALPIMEALEKEGSVTRPYLGVEIYPLEEIPRKEWRETLQLSEDVKGGVYVWSVESLSPAHQAGLKRLDVITHLDGKAVKDMVDLRKILYREKEVGDTLQLMLYRNGKQKELTIKLGKQSS